MKTYTMIYNKEVRTMTADEVLAEMERLESFGFHVENWNSPLFGECFIVCYW